MIENYKIIRVDNTNQLHHVSCGTPNTLIYTWDDGIYTTMLAENIVTALNAHTCVIPYDPEIAANNE